MMQEIYPGILISTSPQSLKRGYEKSFPQLSHGLPIITGAGETNGNRGKLNQQFLLE